MDQTALDGFVNQMTDTLKSGAALAAQEVPGLFTELLRYKLIENILLIGVTLLALLGLRLLWRENPYSDLAVAFVVLAPAVVVVSMFGLCCLFEALQIWIAPRIFLIEYFVQVAKHK